MLLIFCSSCQNEQVKTEPADQRTIHREEQEGHSSTVTYDHDPKTIQDFEKLVGDALIEGATCVRFPSGQYNWNCNLHAKLPQKEKFSKWSSRKGGDMTKKLKKWLTEKKLSQFKLGFLQILAR